MKITFSVLFCTEKLVRSYPSDKSIDYSFIYKQNKFSSFFFSREGGEEEEEEEFTYSNLLQGRIGCEFIMGKVVFF